jgi:hypothetical protein
MMQGHHALARVCLFSLALEETLVLMEEVVGAITKEKYSI